MSSSQKVDLSFIEILLVIIAFNGCNSCSCSDNKLDRINQHLEQIEKKLDR